MIPLLASVILLAPDWGQPTPPYVLAERGLATYYDEGLMVRAARNQGIDIPEGYVPVALNRKGDKGRPVWIHWPGANHVDLAIVVDCAAEEDYAARLNDRRIVEVPAWVARREGFYGVGPWPVEVWYTPWPPDPLHEPR